MTVFSTITVVVVVVVVVLLFLVLYSRCTIFKNIFVPQMLFQYVDFD